MARRRPATRCAKPSPDESSRRQHFVIVTQFACGKPGLLGREATETRRHCALLSRVLAHEAADDPRHRAPANPGNERRKDSHPDVRPHGLVRRNRAVVSFDPPPSVISSHTINRPRQHVQSRDEYQASGSPLLTFDLVARALETGTCATPLPRRLSRSQVSAAPKHFLGSCCSRHSIGFTPRSCQLQKRR